MDNAQAFAQDHAPRVRINTSAQEDIGVIVSLRWDCACGRYTVSDRYSYANHLAEMIRERFPKPVETLADDI